MTIIILFSSHSFLPFSFCFYSMYMQNRSKSFSIKKKKKILKKTSITYPHKSKDN